MFYPVYVHKEPDSAYGVMAPDMPGCFSAADELEDLPDMVREAVECHYEGEDVSIPPPSPIERWQDDPGFQGGFWLLMDIDTSRINTKPVRLDISLPESLAKQIDAYAKARHMTRSGFLAWAATQAMSGDLHV